MANVFPASSPSIRTSYETASIITVFTLAIILLLSRSIYLQAQDIPLFGPVPVVKVHIELEKEHVALGQRPRAVLTIKNPSHQEIALSSASHLFRVHVEGQYGEPSKTEWHRHLHGDFRPGDKLTTSEGPVAGIYIAPDSSSSQIFDLTKFYNFDNPGKYLIYLEVYDQSGPPDGSGKWLCTNKALLEVLPLSH